MKETEKKQPCSLAGSGVLEAKEGKCFKEEQPLVPHAAKRSRNIEISSGFCNMKVISD